MLNGSILGQKFYAARNPRWTKLGKAGKPLLGLRANNQIPGPKGIGEQGIQRAKFAHAAIGLYGTKGFDARGMPAMARRMSETLGYHPEATRQKLEAKRAAAHAAAQARWGGVPVPPSGGQGFGGYQF